MYETAIRRILPFLVCIGISTSSLDIRLKRNIRKSGFHRDLESIIVIPLSILTQCDSASLMLLESLPAGVYADPFQLQAAQHFGGPQVIFDRAVDIEAAAFSSKEHKVKVFVDMDAVSVNSSSEDTLTIVVTLPIHARYHQPSVDPLITHSSVSIFTPQLYLNCRVDDNADGHSLSLTSPYNGKNYKWYQIKYKHDSSKVILKVPVGQEKDKPLVVLITLLVTVIVSALLCKSVLESQGPKHGKLS